MGPHSNLILGLLVIFICRGVSGTTFTFVNKCDFTVWPGILGSPKLGSTGFELTQGGSRSFQAPASWSGRFWGRTSCNFDDSGSGSCATGDCGSGEVECNGGGSSPPVTLAEFTLGTGSGSQDFYDVSLVDGYNLPMIVEVSGGSGSCASTGCALDLSRQCPAELRSSDGGACKSACEAFGTPQYCCRGAYASPSACTPSVYSQMFKSACPKSYSYAFDDSTSTFTWVMWTLGASPLGRHPASSRPFTCAGADYTVTFCPSGPSQKSSNDGPQSGGTESGSGSETTGSGSSVGQLVADGSWLASLATGDSTRKHPLNAIQFFLALTFFFVIF